MYATTPFNFTRISDVSNNQFTQEVCTCTAYTAVRTVAMSWNNVSGENEIIMYTHNYTHVHRGDYNFLYLPDICPDKLTLAGTSYKVIWHHMNLGSCCIT